MGLKQKTITGAKWSAFATAIIIGLGLLQMTFLARMLQSKEFGLLAVAMVIISLADTLSDFGISNSIIQKKIITNSQLSTLYWINVFIGILVSLSTYLLANFISTALNVPALKELIEVLSIAFIVIPHGQQFRALLQKELEFKAIGAIESLSAFLGFIATMAITYFHPIAIAAIYGYLVNTLIRTLSFAYVGRKHYSPSLVFSLKGIGDNLKFGAYVTADSLVNFINTNTSTIILTKLLGPSIAGGYNLAYNIAVNPPSKLNPIITRVLFPAFAKIQDDNLKLKENFFKLLSIVGLLNFPALLGLLVVSNNFVLTIFGEKWSFIIVLLQILCIVGLLRSIGNPIGSLLMAKARVDISFKFNIFKTFLFIPGIIVGAHIAGAIGTAYAFLIVQVINTILSYFILIKPVLGECYKEYLYSIWFPMKMSLPTLVTSFITGLIFHEKFGPGFILCSQIFIGLLFFALTVFLSKAPLVVELKNLVLKKIH